MKKRKLFLIFSTLSFLGLLSFSLTACLDKDMDDYSREKEEKDLARAQAMAGVYRGNLVSRADGAVLGPVEIEVSARTEVVASSSSVRNSRKVVISAGVTLYREHRMPLFFSDGYFDKDSKGFQASMNLGDDSRLDVQAALEGNALVGGIESHAFRESGADFILERNGSLPGRTSRGSGSRAEDFANSVIYKGKVTYLADGTTDPVTIAVIQNTSGTVEDDLKSIFVPVKKLLISGKLGQFSISLKFESTWDFRTGVIKGSQKIVGSSEIYDLRLNCKDTSPGLTGAELKCQINHQDRDKIVKLELKRVDQSD